MKEENIFNSVPLTPPRLENELASEEKTGVVGRQGFSNALSLEQHPETGNTGEVFHSNV